MIRTMPFRPVVTGFAQLSCAGATDAEAVSLFRGERSPADPRPACDVIDSAISDPVFHLDSFVTPHWEPRTLTMLRAAVKRALDRAGLTPASFYIFYRWRI